MSQTEEAVLSRSKLKWASALQNASSLLLLLLLVLSPSSRIEMSLRFKD